MSRLVALLFALSAAPAQPSGLWAQAREALSAAAHRLYRAPDGDVAAGNAKLGSGDAQGALHDYDKAQARRPGSAVISYDRAGALLKLGAGRAGDAAAEAGKALRDGGAALKPRAAFDLGLADEALGDAQGAMNAYRTALTLDPSDVDAKVNLENLLRKKEEQQQTPQAQQQKDQQQKDQGRQKEKGQQGEKPPQEQQAQQPKNDGQKQEQPAKMEEKKEQQQAAQKPVDRSEAERLLDALRASEKNLQAWRFAKEKRKETQRGDPDKDW